MIRTARLSLSPRTVDHDITREVIWLNDPYVMKYSEQRHRKHTIGSQISYICSFGRDGLLYGIRREGYLIGSITASFDRHNGIANVGILIGDVFYWGQGFGSEAWGAFTLHLFKDYGIRKVEAGCMATNSSMIAIAMKNGMSVEGRKLNHFKMEDGKLVDRVELGKFA